MRTLAFVGLVAILATIGAAFFFLTGRYNVSAVEPDHGLVKWALETVREASINRHATGKAAIAVDDPSVIQAGAMAFFKRGCVHCHGAPGADWSKFSEGLRPDAADLNEIAKTHSVGKIFWVIKNGINMTGMPSFARIQVPDEEIWKIAAFVKKLPTVKPEDYKAWTAASGN
ncbi:MAG: cytochrome c [Hyphomicrobiaceae bacterium]